MHRAMHCTWLSACVNMWVGVGAEEGCCRMIMIALHAS